MQDETTAAFSTLNLQNHRRHSLKPDGTCWGRKIFHIRRRSKLLRARITVARSIFVVFIVRPIIVSVVVVTIGVITTAVHVTLILER